MKYLIFTFLLLTSNILKADSLSQVYQKEMAFLFAQKRTLIKQIKKHKKEFNSKIDRARNKVKVLQDKLVMLSADNERLINHLSDAERTLENSELNKNLIETTITRSLVSLGKSDDSVKHLKTDEEKLGFVFDQTFLTLKNGSEKTIVKGEFFLLDGKKVKGDIIKFGSIARFGILNNKAKMLMPVGGGKFKLIKESGIDDIKISFEENPTVLPTFLYESVEKGIEPKKEQTFMEMVDAGGSIAYVIVLLGLVALVLMAIRAFLLYFAGKIDNTLVDDLEKGDLSNIKNKLLDGKTPFSRVLKSTYEVMDRKLEERENVIQESILGELNFLDKFGAVILVMAAVAPLLGLLGTVTGMISTFDIITEFGTGDPKLLSSGISEALITTKLGLMVAIPTLLLGNLFSGWSNKIKIMLEREALRLSNLASSLKFDKGVDHA